MTDKKLLKKYAGPGGGGRVFAAILWVVCIISVFLMIAGLGAGDDPAEATAFHPLDSESGDYCYLDVAGISDWIYEIERDSSTTTYYCAEDAEGYLYTVILYDSARSNLSHLEDWYYRTEDIPAPETQRIYGVSKTLSADVKSTLAEWWEVSESEYEDYFGVMVLDCTTTPSEDQSGMWGVIALMTFLFAIIFGVSSAAAKKNFKRSIKRLEELDMIAMAAEELDAPDNIVIGKDKGRLTRHFIIGRRTGVVMPYSDVEWAYRRITRTNFVATGATLILNTLKHKDIGAIIVPGSDKNGELDAAFQAISENNPDAMLGYSTDFIKAYNAKRKAAK